MKRKEFWVEFNGNPKFDHIRTFRAMAGFNHRLILDPDTELLHLREVDSTFDALVLEMVEALRYLSMSIPANVQQPDSASPSQRNAQSILSKYDAYVRGDNINKGFQTVRKEE